MRRFIIETENGAVEATDFAHAIERVLPFLQATVTADPDIDVYNDLPAPFDQLWANLHDKVENLIIAALAAGVRPEILSNMLISDVDQLIANHS
jgi:hypothetical protein